MDGTNISHIVNVKKSIIRSNGSSKGEMMPAISSKAGSKWYGGRSILGAKDTWRSRLMHVIIKARITVVFICCCGYKVTNGVWQRISLADNIRDGIRNAGTMST